MSSVAPPQKKDLREIGVARALRRRPGSAPVRGRWVRIPMWPLTLRTAWGTDFLGVVAVLEVCWPG